MEKLKPALASIVRGLVVPKGVLKELLTSLEEEATSKGQAKFGPNDGADVKSSGAHNPTGLELKLPKVNVPADTEMESAGAVDPAISGPEAD